MRQVFVRRVDGLDKPKIPLIPQSNPKRKMEASVPAQCVNENKFGEDDRCALKVNCLPRIIAQVADNQHRRIRIARCLGQQPLEYREEGRVIEGPFRRFLQRPNLS